MNIAQYALSLGDKQFDGAPFNLVVKTVTGETLVGAAKPLGGSIVRINADGEEHLVAVAHIVSCRVREA